MLDIQRIAQELHDRLPGEVNFAYESRSRNHGKEQEEIIRVTMFYMGQRYAYYHMLTPRDIDRQLFHERSSLQLVLKIENEINDVIRRDLLRQT